VTRLWGRHIQLEALQRHGNFSTISNAKPLCRNLNYWDSVSTLAGEVAHPKRTFPRALGIAVALVVAMYVGPLLIGLGVTTQSSDWELGYFTRVAQIVRFSILGSEFCCSDALRSHDLPCAVARRATTLRCQVKLSRSQGMSTPFAVVKTCVWHDWRQRTRGSLALQRHPAARAGGRQLAGLVDGLRRSHQPDWTVRGERKHLPQRHMLFPLSFVLSPFCAHQLECLSACTLAMQSCQPTLLRVHGCRQRCAATASSCWAWRSGASCRRCSRGAPATAPPRLPSSCPALASWRWCGLSSFSARIYSPLGSPSLLAGVPYATFLRSTVHPLVQFRLLAGWHTGASSGHRRAAPGFVH